MAKTTKSVDEVRGALVAAKLKGKAIEVWVWDVASGVCTGNGCEGLVGWTKRPKPTKKVTCPCGCNHVVELEYDCCEADLNFSDQFDASDFGIDGGLKKLVLAAVEP